MDEITIGVSGGAAGGGIIATLLTLGVVYFKNRKNGNSSPSENNSDIKTIKKNTFDLKSDVNTLSKSDSDRAKTLQEIRDYTRDSKTIQEQTLAETRKQTEAIIKMGG